MLFFAHAIRHTCFIHRPFAELFPIFYENRVREEIYYADKHTGKQRSGCGMGNRTADEGRSPDAAGTVAETVQDLSGNQKRKMESSDFGFLCGKSVPAFDLRSILQIHFQSRQTCGPTGKIYFFYSGNACKNQKNSSGGRQSD